MNTLIYALIAILLTTIFIFFGFYLYWKNKRKNEIFGIFSKVVEKIIENTGIELLQIRQRKLKKSFANFKTEKDLKDILYCIRVALKENKYNISNLNEDGSDVSFLAKSNSTYLQLHFELRFSCLVALETDSKLFILQCD